MKLAMGGLSKEEVAQPAADFDYRIPLMAGTRKYGDTILLVYRSVSANHIQPVRGRVEGLSVSNKKSKASATLPGKVEKVIHPHPGSGEPEKAQIGVEGADHLYREIRVPNRLTDEDGQKVKLKEGAEVEVKIETDSIVTNGHSGGESRPSHRT